MRVINIVFVIMAFAALFGTSEVTLIRNYIRKIDDADAVFHQFLTRLSTVIDPQPEAVTNSQATTSGLPEVPSNTAFASLGNGLDHMAAGFYQTSDLVHPAAKSPTSESTSLKWNEAGKWGVIGIASAIFTSVAGWIIKLLYEKYCSVARRQQDDTHQHAQDVGHRGQIAPGPDDEVLAARQSWIDQTRLPTDADPVGSLPTDQEMQTLNEYPDAPQIPLQDFGDDFVPKEWLPRMPLAHLPPPRSATPGV